MIHQHQLNIRQTIQPVTLYDIFTYAQQVSILYLPQTVAVETEKQEAPASSASSCLLSSNAGETESRHRYGMKTKKRYQ